MSDQKQLARGDDVGLQHGLRERIAAIVQKLETEGAAMCARFTEQDIRQLHRARLLFHACSIVPCALYYAGASERPTKFPATISFTIRKGLPRLAHHVIWLTGWACMGDVLRRAGSPFIQKFAAAMLATGVWTTIIFRLGSSALGDVFHFLGASA